MECTTYQLVSRYYLLVPVDRDSSFAMCTSDTNSLIMDSTFERASRVLDGIGENGAPVWFSVHTKYHAIWATPLAASFHHQKAPRGSLGTEKDGTVEN